MIRNGLPASLICAFLISCAAAPATTEPDALAPAEIREYQGENLASIYSLPDNSIAGPQTVSREDYRLTVTGLVDRPLSLTYEEVLDHAVYQKAVTLYCVEGWDAAILWEGVLISDLLDPAGIHPEAVTIIFHAADGYTSSMALDFIREKKILLAYAMNGVTLPAERGFPFQVVAESKWGYKWVKWVTGIELSDDAGYEGYWEERGYNNAGDLSGSKFAD